MGQDDQDHVTTIYILGPAP